MEFVVYVEREPEGLCITVTIAPYIAIPLESLTEPLIDEVISCACAGMIRFAEARAIAVAVEVFKRHDLSAELIIRPFMLDFKLFIFSPFRIGLVSSSDRLTISCFLSWIS